jgi:hypothetical protein
MRGLMPEIRTARYVHRRLARWMSEAGWAEALKRQLEAGQEPRVPVIEAQRCSVVLCDVPEPVREEERLVVFDDLRIPDVGGGSRPGHELNGSRTNEEAQPARSLFTGEMRGYGSRREQTRRH